MAKVNVYEKVTAQIIAQLENGIIPWEKPWFGRQSGPVSGATGKPYSLLNQLLLLKPGRWYTYNQVSKLGGKVRKGEESSFCVFWKQIPIKETAEDGEEKTKLIPMLRYYNVFHESQCDGLPERKERTFNNQEIHEAQTVIDSYVGRENITLEIETSDEAWYSPSNDIVHLPRLDQFLNSASYYATAFHELVHSTGHKNRLDRFTSNCPAFFGSEDYSKEELVAELGSAMLMAACEIDTDGTKKNNTAYIQSWLRALKNDQKMVVGAASKAEKAADYILGEEN